MRALIDRTRQQSRLTVPPFAWMPLHRLVQDDEREPGMVAGLHVIAGASLTPHRLLVLAGQSPSPTREEVSWPTRADSRC